MKKVLIRALLILILGIIPQGCQTELLEIETETETGKSSQEITLGEVSNPKAKQPIVGDKVIKTLTIGDSLSAGGSYAEILSKDPRFKGSKVIALSSMNTTWMRNQLLQELKRIEQTNEKPYRFIIVFGGTNYSESRQEDLQQMYSLIKQYGAKSIGVTLPLGKLAQRDKPLNEWIKKNPTLYLVVDFATEKREDFIADRIHLTAKKQKKMAEQLAKQLTTK